MNTYFTGEHDKVIQNRGAQGTQSFDPENIDRKLDITCLTGNLLEIIQRGNQQANVTELDRLSYVVHTIDQECAVVPAEAFKGTPNGELVKNINFRGEAPGKFTLASFRHFRDIPEEQKIKVSGKWNF